MGHSDSECDKPGFSGRKVPPAPCPPPSEPLPPSISDLVKNIQCTQAEKDALLLHIAMERELAKRDLSTGLQHAGKRKQVSAACRKPAPYDHTSMDVEHFLVVLNRWMTDMQLEDEEKITALLTFLEGNTLKKVLQTAPELAEGTNMDWPQYRERFVQVIGSLKREQALTARMSLKSRRQKTGETFWEFAEALTEIADKGWARAEETAARELVLKQALINGTKNYWVRVWLIQNQEKYPIRELVAEASVVEVSHRVQEPGNGEIVEASVLRAQAPVFLPPSVQPPQQWPQSFQHPYLPQQYGPSDAASTPARPFQYGVGYPAYSEQFEPGNQQCHDNQAGIVSQAFEGLEIHASSARTNLTGVTAPHQTSKN